jgi:hypothetical protein
MRRLTGHPDSEDYGRTNRSVHGGIQLFTFSAFCKERRGHGAVNIGHIACARPSANRQNVKSQGSDRVCDRNTGVSNASRVSGALKSDTALVTH